jgi:uncharacterized protein (TIGR00730 family)
MRLAVYCGSKAGERPQYRLAADAFARELAARRIGLVYGGASVGLMGALATTVLACGGEAIGVIPEAMVQRELAHTGLTELHVVATMHERKALMADLSDGFVALPGGPGTLDEFFEAWTWGQLGLHHKPLGLLDVDGYFDHLLAFTDRMVESGFLRPDHRAMIHSASTPGVLLNMFDGYEPPEAKWTDLR